MSICCVSVSAHTQLQSVLFCSLGLRTRLGKQTYHFALWWPFVPTLLLWTEWSHTLSIQSLHRLKFWLTQFHQSWWTLSTSLHVSSLSDSFWRKLVCLGLGLSHCAQYQLKYLPACCMGVLYILSHGRLGSGTHQARVQHVQASGTARMQSRSSWREV